jgi:hypothetical protein
MFSRLLVDFSTIPQLGKLFKKRSFSPPEIRLHIDNIKKAYTKVFNSHVELLHPNLNKLTLRPWGAKEFALIDFTQVCVNIQQGT